MCCVAMSVNCSGNVHHVHVAVTIETVLVIRV